MKRSQLILFICVLMLFAGTAGASLYTGTLSTADGTLVGGESWANNDENIPTTFSYLVDDFTTAGMWHYSYTLTVPNIPGSGADISHLLVEVSGTLTAELLQNLSHSVIVEQVPANQTGMPEGLYGALFEDVGETTSLTISFDTIREPIWGDFFAKGGKGNWVRNSGFGEDDVDPTTPATAQEPDHILVADTIPEPSAMMLLLSGAVPAFMAIRRRR